MSYPAAPNPPPVKTKLLDQVRHAIRTRHYSHPNEMGAMYL
jgi:hypothetical protein